MTSWSELRGRVSVGARVRRPRPGCRRLAIPPGPAEAYRIAQLDDYAAQPRQDFRWRAPVRLRLSARVSAQDHPGTWGFGWWNDPFAAHLGLRGTSRRLPALPNAAWIFYASPENHLALRDDHPAHGLLAATFAAPSIPATLLALGSPALPLLLWRFTAKWLRRAARWFVREDAALLDVDPTSWHRYEIVWRCHAVRFLVDDAVCITTPVAPQGPLGLVLWIDNQYAGFRADGRLSMGTLTTPAAWLEVADVWVGT